MFSVPRWHLGHGGGGGHSVAEDAVRTLRTEAVGSAIRQAGRSRVPSGETVAAFAGTWVNPARGSRACQDGFPAGGSKRS